MSVLSELVYDPWDYQQTFWARDLTLGDYATEDQSCRAFDALIARSAGFRVVPEVTGRYQGLRPHQERRDPRIDRIIIPTPALVEAGWSLGPVGVELKRSGVKIGPVISQAIDYSRALWQLPDNPLWFSLAWVFVWPMAPQMGPTGSIVSQQRIGSIKSDRRQRLTFMSGQHMMARWDGEWTVKGETMKHGCKVGSR